MMRGYYAKHAFASFARVTCGQAQAVANERGRFVAFLLEPDQNAVAMVEISDQGPKVDWEILVNYPAVQWKDFLAKRPAGEQDLAVTISRCYVREDFLAKEEKLVRDQLLGLRIGLPGSDDQLFAAIPVDSEPGRWIVAHVPWEHENKSAPVRARLAFDPSHAAMPERVVIGAIPVTGWTR